MLEAAHTAAQEPLASAETVLWAAWHATGLARNWQEQALTGGSAGRQADRNLDAVVALFAAAARFVERMPGASISALVNQVCYVKLPAGSLSGGATEMGRSHI